LFFILVMFDNKPFNFTQMTCFFFHFSLSELEFNQGISSIFQMQHSIDNLQKIMTFVQDLDTAGVGGNITGGIAEELEAAGWDVSAETLATNLETAINSAFIMSRISAPLPLRSLP